MSGTSADAIDAALVELRGHGEALDARLLAFESTPLDPVLARRVIALPEGSVAELCRLDFELGEAFAAATVRVVAAAGLTLGEVHLVGSHGQTARHDPPDPLSGVGGATLQIGQAAVIAERTGLPVVSDFRVGDVAAGGQGAPLIPLADYLLFRETGTSVALLNLGGIANVTVLGASLDELLGFDTGPANMCLDLAAQAASGGLERYDRDGARAARGTVDTSLLHELLGDPYFAAPPPKSTGRERFGRALVDPLLARFAGRLDDLVATLTAFTVESVALALERFVLPHRRVTRLWVSGGGVHNRTLLARLAARLAPLPVASLAERGMDPDAKEAVGFAILAHETLFAAPGNVPTATGARGPRILGKITLPTRHE
ncbi:MAG: anhydro-N-acetylmuramic acid kinase [Deltaproteobacteria bacterium]|nr:anhydro-N-acetylmuramic acid kinase [Deltaproteobacteria bacterium]